MRNDFDFGVIKAEAEKLQKRVGTHILSLEIMNINKKMIELSVKQMTAINGGGDGDGRPRDLVIIRPLLPKPILSQWPIVYVP